MWVMDAVEASNAAVAANARIAVDHELVSAIVRVNLAEIVRSAQIATHRARATNRVKTDRNAVHALTTHRVRQDRTVVRKVAMKSVETDAMGAVAMENHDTQTRRTPNASVRSNMARRLQPPSNQVTLRRPLNCTNRVPTVRGENAVVVDVEAATAIAMAARRWSAMQTPRTQTRVPSICRRLSPLTKPWHLWPSMSRPHPRPCRLLHLGWKR